jgi:hypothetical protein
MNEQINSVSVPSSDKFKISPKFTAEKLDDPSFDDLVDVFEDRLIGWLINPARALNELEHAGFAVFQVLLAYFEGHATFYRGEDSKHKSEAFFKAAFLQVFPEILEYGDEIADQIISIMYHDVRCGLYHTGMARRRFVLNDGQTTIRVGITGDHDVQVVIVDRYSFVDRIESHLGHYVKRLRDQNEVELRDNFNLAWKLAHA